MGNKNVKQSLPFGLKTQFQREGKLLRKNSYKGVDDELTAGSWSYGRSEQTKNWS